MRITRKRLRLGFRAGCIAAALLSSSTQAEQCPADKPSWLRGRVVVFEQNLSPPRLRGVGEVFVYAYQHGNTPPGLRRMAVSDAEGHFCIHDTASGPWVVTAFEPFAHRPFVRELTCTSTSCDLGELRVDESQLRISDDFVGWQDGWWGGPFAQTLTMPQGARNIVHITFRSGAGSTNEVKLFAGETVAGTAVATAGLSIAPKGGRGAAVFQPGEAVVSPSQVVTVFLGGGAAPWRLSSGYPAGGMFGASGGSLTPMPGLDLCLTADLDGVDGNLTSFFATGSGSYVYAGTVAQSFIARSPEITHASVVGGTPSGFRRIQASISDTKDGPAIGPVRETIGLDQQGAAFAWFRGEVPVKVGSRYFVRFHFPEGGHAVYTRETDPLGKPPYPAGQLFADGVPKPGALWGRVLGPEVASPPVDAGVTLPSDAGPAVVPDAGAGQPAAGGGQAEPQRPATPGSPAGPDSPGAVVGCSCQGAAGLVPSLLLALAGLCAPWGRRRHHG